MLDWNLTCTTAPTTSQNVFVVIRKGDLSCEMTIATPLFGIDGEIAEWHRADDSSHIMGDVVQWRPLPAPLYTGFDPNTPEVEVVRAVVQRAINDTVVQVIAACAALEVPGHE